MNVFIFENLQSNSHLHQFMRSLTLDLLYKVCHVKILIVVVGHTNWCYLLTNRLREFLSINTCFPMQAFDHQ